MNVKKAIPYDFIFDFLETEDKYTKAMFGATAVYIGEKIVFMLRQREQFPEDNGVWLATLKEHQESLKEIFPNMRSLIEFGPGETDWQVLPEASEDFEESVRLACELVMGGDERVGKVPKRRKLKTKS